MCALPARTATPVLGQGPPMDGASFHIYSGEEASPQAYPPRSKSAGNVAFAENEASPYAAASPSWSPPRNGPVVLGEATPGATPGRQRFAGGATPGSQGGATPGTAPNKRRTAAATGNKSGSSRIDPEQVPRPVSQQDAVKEEGGKRYETGKYHMPPAATTVCTIVDTGSCSCEFMRCTVNQVPSYPSTAIRGARNGVNHNNNNDNNDNNDKQ